MFVPISPGKVTEHIWYLKIDPTELNVDWEGMIVWSQQCVLACD